MGFWGFGEQYVTKWMDGWFNVFVQLRIAMISTLIARNLEKTRGKDTRLKPLESHFRDFYTSEKYVDAPQIEFLNTRKTKF